MMEKKRVGEWKTGTKEDKLERRKREGMHRGRKERRKMEGIHRERKTQRKEDREEKGR